MKITVNPCNHQMILEEIYEPVILKTPNGELVTLCMRDGGLEITHGSNVHQIAKDHAQKEPSSEPFEFGWCLLKGPHAKDSNKISIDNVSMLAPYNLAKNYKDCIIKISGSDVEYSITESPKFISDYRNGGYSEIKINPSLNTYVTDNAVVNIFEKTG